MAIFSQPCHEVRYDTDTHASTSILVVKCDERAIEYIMFSVLLQLIAQIMCRNCNTTGILI